MVENKDIGMRKTILIEKLSVKLIAWMMTIIMFFLSMVSILYRSYIDVTYQEIIHYRKDNVVLAVIFVLAVITVIYLLQKKKWLDRIPTKILLIIMLIYVTVVSGLWAYTTDSIPVADQRSILNCVQGLIHGDYSCMDPKSPAGYLQYNRHQVGLTAFLELFTRFFTGGDANYHAVYGLNVFMIAGIFLGLYLITTQLTARKDVVNLELFLSFGMFQLMMYSTFVYGLIPGLFFVVFGIYSMLRLFKSKKWYFGVLMSLMCAFSIIMKSNYMVFLIAVGITIIVKAIGEKYPLYLMYLMLAIVFFVGINTTAQKVYENRTGIEFGDTIPNTAYLAMAMQEGPMAPGWFNGFNHVTYRDNNYNETITDQISREYIAERLQEFANNPKECIEFYYKKIVSQWNEVTYECFWISINGENRTRELSPIMEKIYIGTIHTMAESVMNLYQLLLFVGTFVLAATARKNNDISKMILLLCLLGGFLFHILWEGKSQYIISYFPLFLPCAAIGLIAFVDCLKLKRGKESSNGFFAEK